jgi:hypothetical protein
MQDVIAGSLRFAEAHDPPIGGKRHRGVGMVGDGVGDGVDISGCIFEKLDVSPGPLLIQVDNIASTALVAEDGTDARPVLKHIYETLRSSPDHCDLPQQSNFRLRRPIPATGLKLWFINVLHWHPFAPEYSLHSLSTGHDAPGYV